VPEPTTAALIACGFTALVVRRCAHSRVAM
jgi:hypothetical protein